MRRSRATIYVEGRERARAGLGARTLPQSAADSAPRAPLGLAAETLRSSTCAHVVVELRAASRALCAHVARTARAPPHRCAAALRLPAAPGGWSIRTVGVADESAHRRKLTGGREDDHKVASREPERGRLGRRRCAGEQGARERARSRGWAGGPPTVGAEGAEGVLRCRLGSDLRAQGRCAEGRGERPNLCAHCQIGDQAQSGVSAACACPLEAG